MNVLWTVTLLYLSTTSGLPDLIQLPAGSKVPGPRLHPFDQHTDGEGPIQRHQVDLQQHRLQAAEVQYRAELVLTKLRKMLDLGYHNIMIWQVLSFT